MSLLYGIIGGILGGIIGWFVPWLGVPLGFAIGTALGGLASLTFSGGDTVITYGPRLSDLSVQTSSYGADIPKVYGTVRIAGNVFWSRGIEENLHIKHLDGDAEFWEYTYYGHFAVGLCEGPIAGIRKIFLDGKLFADLSSELGVGNQTIISEQETNIYTVHTGIESQAVDIPMSLEGIEVAYRGLAFIRFSNLPLKNFGNRLPQVTCEVVASGYVAAGNYFIDNCDGIVTDKWDTTLGSSAPVYSSSYMSLNPTASADAVNGVGAHVLDDRETVGEYEFSFDYWQNNDWYDDDPDVANNSEAEFAITQANPDDCPLTTCYRQIEENGYGVDSKLFINLRTNTSGKIRVSERINGAVTQLFEENFTYHAGSFDSIKFIVNFSAHWFEIWDMYGTPTQIGSRTSFSESLLDYIVDTFTTTVHFHNYSTDREVRFDNFSFFQGAVTSLEIDAPSADVYNYGLCVTEEGNLVSCNSDTQLITVHEGLSDVVLSQFSCPNPRGTGSAAPYSLAVWNGDLFVGFIETDGGTDYDYVSRHVGYTAATRSVTEVSFSPSGLIGGIAIYAGNLYVAERNANEIYKYPGLIPSVTPTWTKTGLGNSNSGNNIWGLTFDDSGNLHESNTGDEKIFKRAGEGAQSDVMAFLAEWGSNSVAGIYYDKNNDILWVSRLQAAQLVGLDGFTTSITWFNEGFESGDYDESNWNDFVNGSGTKDVNATPHSAAVNWGSKCMECEVFGGATDDAAIFDVSMSESSFYFRTDVIIDSMTSINEFGVVIAKADWNTFLDIAWEVEVIEVDSTLYFQLQIKHNGSTFIKFLSDPLSLDTQYTVEVNWNSDNDTWSWSVDGSQRDSGTLTGSAAGWSIETILVGIFSAFSNTAKIYFDNIQIERASSAIPIRQIGLLVTEDIDLEDIVKDVCDEVGVTASLRDTSQLAGTSVRGYTRSSTMEARRVLEPLMAVYNFDVAEYDHKLNFIMRGGASQVSIPEAEIGAYEYGQTSPDKMPILRNQEMDFPRVLSVSFISHVNDYGIGSSRSIRMSTESKRVSKIEYPIVMTHTEAKQTAEILHNTMWTERMRYLFSTFMKYLWLAPTDVITVDGFKMRIEAMGIKGGLLQIEGPAEVDANYTSEATTEDPDHPDQTIGTDGPSASVILDIPILEDTDNNAGFYIAVHGYGDTEWSGALVYTSIDGGASYQPTIAIVTESIIGSTTDALADASPAVFDRDNTVNVVLGSNNFSLISAPAEVSVLNGMNWAAIGAHGRWEIIGFKTATLEADGSYTLSTLLRGLKGTEWATDLHTAADTFVMLNRDNLGRYNSGPSYIDVEQFYKIISVRNDPQASTGVAFTNSAVGLETYAPSDIRGSRDGYNNLTITWKRRGRIDHEWNDYQDVPLGETTEAYEIDIMDGASVKRTITGLTSETYTYTIADQITDWGDVKDPCTVNIYQLSSDVNRGYVGAASISSEVRLVAEASLDAILIS